HILKWVFGIRHSRHTRRPQAQGYLVSIMADDISQQPMSKQLMLGAFKFAIGFLSAALFVSTLLCGAFTGFALTALLCHLYRWSNRWYRENRSRIEYRLTRTQHALSTNRHRTMPAIVVSTA